MNAAHQVENLKQLAAAKAMEFIRPGMVVGLGTGSTANYMIAELGRRVKEGLYVQGVPTSQETAALARRHGIPLVEQDAQWTIDVALDGADQADPALNLIKGGGGALLKEKIVATAARQFIVMVDHAKCVPVLGVSMPLPVEVVPFGWGNTARQLELLTNATGMLRRQHNEIFLTEAGHYIVDLHVGPIADPAQLERELKQVVGVVETGLFVGRTHLLIVGRPDGVQLTAA